MAFSVSSVSAVVKSPEAIMRRTIFHRAWLVLVLLAWTPSGRAQAFIFDVKHDHTWGSCAGKLIINPEGIEYSTEKEEHRRKWIYRDLKRIEISSRKELVLHTYEDVKARLGDEREFEFKLQDGEIIAETYEFLLSKATRPVLTRVAYSSASYTFVLPAKHRHLWGGCQGELKVSEHQVAYETDSKDARIWLFEDITAIGLMDRYNLQITTLLENYTFDLKEPMGPEQHQFLWAKIYKLEKVYPDNQPGARRVP